MHILVTVFFNASRGGLHENVYASARYLIGRGHDVTVVCKPGPFASQLMASGAAVIETDYLPQSVWHTFKAIECLHRDNPIDVVHAHPFASRKLALWVARALGLPLALTIHGKYTDDLPTYLDEVDVVFAVSEGIRQHLLASEGIGCPEKIHVLPNTPDSPYQADPDDTLEVGVEEPLTLTLVTRLDADKAFILEVFYRALAHTAARYPEAVQWRVVGDGRLRAEVEENARALAGPNSLEFVGWQEGEALWEEYRRSDVALAPGRCALEAMSCAVPVLAVGSKGYSGLVGPSRWQHAVYTNFGGVGDKLDDYREGEVEKDLDRLLESPKRRRQYGRLGRDIVTQFFNSSEFEARLLSFYRIIRQVRQISPRHPVGVDDVLELRLRGVHVSRPAPDRVQVLVECHDPASLMYAWEVRRGGEVVAKYSYRPVNRLEHVFCEGGEFSVRCFIRDEGDSKLSFIAANMVAEASAP